MEIEVRVDAAAVMLFAMDSSGAREASASVDSTLEQLRELTDSWRLRSYANRSYDSLDLGSPKLVQIAALHRRTRLLRRSVDVTRGPRSAARLHVHRLAMTCPASSTSRTSSNSPERESQVKSSRSAIVAATRIRRTNRTGGALQQMVYAQCSAVPQCAPGQVARWLARLGPPRQRMTGARALQRRSDRRYSTINSSRPDRLRPN